MNESTIDRVFPAAIPAERRTTLLTTLVTLTQRMTETLELDEVLSSIVRSVAELTRSDVSRLFLFDEREEVLRLRAAFGGDLSTALTETYRPGESAAGQAFLSGKTIFENDYLRADRPKDIVWAAHEKVGSFILQPLRRSGKVIGVLNCFSRRRHAYTDEDLEILEGFAAQAAIALHNAAIHTEAVRSRNFFQNLLDQNADAIIISEPDSGRILHWNAAAESLFGYAAEEAAGQPIAILIPGGKYPSSAREKVLANGHPVHFECTRQRKDGSFVPLSSTLSPIRDDKDRLIAIVSIHRDLTARKQLEESLRRSSARFEQLSLHDELTGLFNRRAFVEHIERETDRSRRHGAALSFAMLDLDHFKRVNDDYGHAMGDSVLHRTAETIAHVSRGTDICARYGGEEFGLILPHTDLEGAQIIVKRLQEAIAANTFTAEDGRTFSVTCSAGLSEFKTESDSGATLIGRADEALYQAKQAGRNRIFTA